MKGAKDLYHKIQSWIILFCVDDGAQNRQVYIDAIVEYLHDELQTHGAEGVKEHLRFFTHVIIFLRDLGLLERERLSWPEDEADKSRYNFVCGNRIIQAYIAQLIAQKSAKNYEYLARYTFELDRETQVVTYAGFLNDIKDTDTRRQCLQFAEDARLDVSRITKLVVENITKTGLAPADLGGFGAPVNANAGVPRDSKISAADRSKIQSIEWLTFHRSDKLEAMKQSNTIMREFISARKMDAAQEVFLLLPTDSVDEVNTVFATELAHDLDEMRRLTATVAEHKGIKAYIEANDAFNAWFKCFNDRPALVAESAYGNDVQGLVQSDANQGVNDGLMARWHQKCTALAEDVEYKILISALSETDGDVLFWLRGGGELADNRGQLRLLKKQCIPQLFTMLHTVLHRTGKYKDCLKIADFIVASDELTAVFGECKQELRTLLKSIRESSLMILRSDQNLDALGYPLVPLEQ